jgi:uncharacterized coiled-coil protein SlyX
MGHRGQGVIDAYRTGDVEFHRKLYAEKAAPFLRIQARTPSQTEQTIAELQEKLAKRDQTIRDMRWKLQALMKDMGHRKKAQKGEWNDASW